MTCVLEAAALSLPVACAEVERNDPDKGHDWARGEVVRAMGEDKRGRIEK